MGNQVMIGIRGFFGRFSSKSDSYDVAGANDDIPSNQDAENVDDHVENVDAGCAHSPDGDVDDSTNASIVDVVKSDADDSGNVEDDDNSPGIVSDVDIPSKQEEAQIDDEIELKLTPVIMESETPVCPDSEIEDCNAVSNDEGLEDRHPSVECATEKEPGAISELNSSQNADDVPSDIAVCRRDSAKGMRERLQNEDDFSGEDNPELGIETDGLAAESGFDPAVQGATQEDHFYNNNAFKDKSIDPTNVGQQEAALKIQTKQRQHVAKQVTEEIRQEQAATTIQAKVRGDADRKTTDEDTTSTVDIDLDDPDVLDAATKIQASFRGFKARHDVVDQARKEAEARDALDKGAEETTDTAASDDVADIDLNDKDLEKAATKIQAGYRGFAARKELKTDKAQEQPAELETAESDVDIDLDDPELTKAATKIQAGFRGYVTRKEMETWKQTETADAETTQEKEEADDAGVDIDLEDPDVQMAAMKIQAGYKGFKVRQDMKSNQDAEPEPEPVEVTQVAASAEAEEDADDEIDIDLTDPEVEKAASKIQAGFKGFKTRKELKQQQNDADETTIEAEEDEVIHVTEDVPMQPQLEELEEQHDYFAKKKKVPTATLR